MPIKGNYRDGLSAFEYFVAANGGRKGQADQSLRTSSAGYLTRKLVDVSHSVIVRQEDCGYEGKGIEVRRDDVRRLSFEDRVFGRVAADDVLNSKGDKIVEKNQTIDRAAAKEIGDDAKIEAVFVRSPINCESPLGICQKCYGYNMEKDDLIEMGRAVGVIAAQSIGEPGTQLTMRTFHKGGVEKTDITQGLPRVEELFEARTPKKEAEIASFAGKVKVEKREDDSTTIIITGRKKVYRSYAISDAKKVNVKDGDTVKTGESIFIDSFENQKEAPFDSVIKIDHGIMQLEGELNAEEVINVLPKVDVLVSDGEEVRTGQILTEGSVDPKKLSEVAGIDVAQKYVIDEAQKVFNEQGVSLSDIHFEIITRQMARLGRVVDSGDSDYLVGSLVNRYLANNKNQLLRESKQNIALIVPKLLGIKASSLYTESFLSAMSFQEQVRVLTSSAILGKTDYLRGMKENVIIGKKIPSGEEARIDNLEELEELSI
ncbi:MAG TPA: hypothetical protein ENN64_01255 [bacterium]|nr:hypothetical protein [bacterium]